VTYRRLRVRALLGALLAAVVLTGLAGCRTSPGVAAYVGDHQVTVTQLDDAVSARLADPAIAAYAKGKSADFTRRVLSLLVQEDVYAAAEQHWNVQVTNADVRSRIKELLGSDDPATVYAQLAQQGIGQDDIFENVREQLIRAKVAAAEGKSGATSEADLRAAYAQLKPTLAKVRFGYITVPDQATATAVLARLTADPASYPAYAAKYKGPYTVPTLEAHAQNEIPTPLVESVSKAKPNTGFTLPLQEVGGVIVGFVAGIEYPSFEEERPALEKQAADAANNAAGQLIANFQETLHVTVNPRYGELKNGQLQAANDGVVKVLSSSSSSAAPSPGAAAPTAGGN
jgi:peptidyl-prolyl cis-trans isomerase SurA